MSISRVSLCWVSLWWVPLFWMSWRLFSSLRYGIHNGCKKSFITLGLVTSSSFGHKKLRNNFPENFSSLSQFYKTFFPGHWLHWRSCVYVESNQGILKGEVSLYCWPPVRLVWNQLFDYLTIFVLICKTDWFKLVKQEVNGTVILPPLVFPGLIFVG